MATLPSPSKSYAKATSEQLKCLGLFVEAFEGMVHQVRSGCIDLLSANTQYAEWISIPFYHQALTAKPLFEIYRGIVAQMMSNDSYCLQQKINDTERECYRGVMACIAGEYNNLCEMRNHLLHGTWYIGHGSPNDFWDASTFEIHRLKVDKNGLSKQKDLPKNADELRHLTRRCNETRIWISILGSCLPASLGSAQITNCFCRKGDRWERAWPSEGKLPAE